MLLKNIFYDNYPHDQQEKIEVEKEEELQIFRQLFFQI